MKINSMFFAMLVLFSSAVYAQQIALPKTVDSSGGGNAVGNQLLDFVEPTFEKKIDLKELGSYQQKIIPILKNIRNKIPRLAMDLESVTDQKKWMQVFRPLAQNQCKNFSMIAIDSIVVACQDDRQVLIDWVWFSHADLDNQAGLLLHEMVRGVAMDNSRTAESTMVDQGIRSLTRALFFSLSISEGHLQKLLVDNLNVSAGDYRTVQQIKEQRQKTLDEIKKANAYVDRFVPYLSFGPRGEITVAEIQSVIDGLEALINDGADHDSHLRIIAMTTVWQLGIMIETKCNQQGQCQIPDYRERNLNLRTETSPN